MPKAELFTIGEFSAMTGLGIHSLRYYDEIGALYESGDVPADSLRALTQKSPEISLRGFYISRPRFIVSQRVRPLTHLFIMQLTAFVPSSSIIKASFSELQR